MLFKWKQTLVDFFKTFYLCPCLTDAVCLCHAFSRYAVAPQALMHVTAGLAVLHPVISGCRDHQEYISHSCTKQSTSHKAVHLEPTDKISLTKYESINSRYFSKHMWTYFNYRFIKNCSKYECIQLLLNVMNSINYRMHYLLIFYIFSF